MKYISAAEIAKIYKRHFRVEFDNQTKAGEFYDCCRQFITSVGSGKRFPSKKLLKALGYKKITVFVKDDAQ